MIYQRKCNQYQRFMILFVMIMKLSFLCCDPIMESPNFVRFHGIYPPLRLPFINLSSSSTVDLQLKNQKSLNNSKSPHVAPVFQRVSHLATTPSMGQPPTSHGEARRQQKTEDVGLPNLGLICSVRIAQWICWSCNKCRLVPFQCLPKKAFNYGKLRSG